MESREFSAKERHDAYPPSTWAVIKTAPRLWSVIQPDGVVVTSAKTKHEAVEATKTGFYVTLWHKKESWYKGQAIAGWKSYSECAR